jgi:enoyl-CoA hydratase
MVILMAFSNIETKIEDRVALLTINRPEKLNALNLKTMAEIRAALDLFKDPAVSCVIITGAGEKAFVAGADIQELSEVGVMGAKNWLKEIHLTMNMVDTFPKPVLAAVNGYALGGGAELALACDTIFASETAKFGLPEINLGIFPGGGGTQRLPRRVGLAKAKELILGGGMIVADEALRMGLINRVYPAAKLLAKTKEFAAHLARLAPIALREAKKAVNRGYESPLEAGLDLELELCASLFETEDKKEGMAAFLEKRKPSFKGK